MELLKDNLTQEHFKKEDTSWSFWYLLFRDMTLKFKLSIPEKNSNIIDKLK